MADRRGDIQIAACMDPNAVKAENGTFRRQPGCKGLAQCLCHILTDAEVIWGLGLGNQLLGKGGNLGVGWGSNAFQKVHGRGMVGLILDAVCHREIFQGELYVLAVHGTAGQLGGVAPGTDDCGPDGLFSQSVFAAA